VKVLDKRKASKQQITGHWSRRKLNDQNFIQNQKIKTKELKYPIEVFNVDGTPNKQGTIMKYTWLDLTINRQTWTHNLLVTGLGKQKIILGYLWFKQTNLDIN
jgi:hypothetical protein